MTDLLLRALAWATLGLALVLVLRRPARRLFGAGPAFTLWLLPLVLMLAPLLPRGAVPAVGWTLPAVLVTPDATLAATAPQAAHAAWGWLVAVWWAGVAIGLARLAVQYLRLRRAVQPLPQALQREVQRIVADVDARRLRVHDAGPAVLFALPRALLLLPADFAERFRNTATRELVLRHEITHACRGDAWWSLAMEVASALLWFHPLAWLARARFRLDQELACDAASLRTCPQRSAGYARALLDSVAVQPAPVLIPWLAEPQLEERIAMLVRNPPSTLRRRAGFMTVAGLLVGTIAVAGMAQAAKVSPSRPAAHSTGSSAPAAAASTIDPSVDAASQQANMPLYPLEAVQDGDQGTVLLDVTIDARGNVVAAVVDPKGTFAAPALQGAAIDAVKKWKFHPGIKDGHRMGGVVEVPVNFGINATCADGYMPAGRAAGPSYSCLAQPSVKPLPAPKCLGGFRVVPMQGGSYECAFIDTGSKQSS